MKRIILAASLIIAATSFTGISTVNASTTTVALAKKGTHISPSEVPAPVMASFNTHFPTASNVEWQKEREHGQTTYQADFLKRNGTKWRAVFAPDGTLLSSSPK